MEAVVHGIGITGPGLPDWETARHRLAAGPVEATATPCRPRSALLDKAEARRAPDLVHLALATAEQVLPRAADVPPALPTVFASADGDLDILERSCRTLAESDPWISPNRFHNSVHNAPSGYWSIANGCQGPSTTLSAGDATFAAGLLEAVTQVVTGSADACLLVVYDQASPATLADARPVDRPFAAALLLGRDGPGPRLHLGLDGPGEASACTDPGLERLRGANPAARGLPLLVALARAKQATLSLARAGGTLRLDLEAPA